jgi:hypothetical protein
VPVVIWLMPRFPEEPPLPYVVPTQTMVIKTGHPHVDRNGQVGVCVVGACTCMWDVLGTIVTAVVGAKQQLLHMLCQCGEG